MLAPIGLRRRINKKCGLKFLCMLLIVGTVSYCIHTKARWSGTTLMIAQYSSQNKVNDYWLNSRGGRRQEAERIDWHTYGAMLRESERRGVGECGAAAKLADYVSQARSIKETGFNALLSDSISVERSLPDVRHKGCRNRKYLARLPATSIIIIYYNEHLSVLLRTVHSLLNRTPAQLLLEVILVDDCSTNSLHAEIAAYISQYLTAKVRILRLRKRAGLIRARMAGARAAKGDVLVFLDAHIEATHNWLPPLLEPIALDWRTVTTPIIDTINYDTFAYVPQQAHGTRGHFDWHFNYVQLPLLPEEVKQLPEPHANPVMNGGLFAIAAKFFWHLGAYDEQLVIWGAEQFELSFKIWMCGGQLLEVPCARMGHLYRDEKFRVQHERKDDFVARNYKRVAEVWMDEYKQYLYEWSPKLFTIDAGDLSARHALRKRLQCKSFKWFLTHVAFDLFSVYPPVEPPDFASGALESLATPGLCVEALPITEKREQINVLQLRACVPDLKHPFVSQQWHFSFRHELRFQGKCLEVQNRQQVAVPLFWSCHLQGGNQYWTYDRPTQMLVNHKTMEEQSCLEADPSLKRLLVKACELGKSTMRWRFGYVNNTAMDRQWS